MPQRPSVNALTTLPRQPFLERVRVSNYKSIDRCDVTFRPLTVLVGRNGAGKSNFLDALRFVADSLQTSLDHAIKSRGGIDAVRRKSTGHPRNFAIDLLINVPEARVARYRFEIAARARGGFAVKREWLEVTKANGEREAEYKVRLTDDGEPEVSGLVQSPPVARDRLYLVTAAGLPKFRPVYDALSSMGFYNLNPDTMKEPQAPDAGELLHRDGGNIASVIGRLSNDNSALVVRINEYLRTIVPGIEEVERVALGPRETLEFRQTVIGSRHAWRFYANSMSDGTLRALGNLVAVTQLANRQSAVRLVALEEPETALHPAAAGALMDALREATNHTQVLVASHSPDLLESVNMDADALLVVRADQGRTDIAPVDAANRATIDQHLYNAGDLLRMNQLAPDHEHLARTEQMSLFDDDEGAA